ncbi:MAG TPA: hypothetical protein VI075_00745, partial [Methyloceanibacter sp.]
MAKTAKSGRKAVKSAWTGKVGRKPKAAPKPKAKKTKRASATKAAALKAKIAKAKTKPKTAAK